MRPSRLFVFCLATETALVVMVPHTYAIPAYPLGTFQETQPDGRIVTLSLNGDTHDSWMVDEEQHTVVRDPVTGFFVYARPDGKGGLEASTEIVPEQLTDKNRNKNMKGPFYQEGQHQELPPNSPSDSFPSTTGYREFSQIPFKRQKNLRPSKRDCQNKICGEHHNHKDLVDRRKLGLRGWNSSQSKINTTSSGPMYSIKNARAEAKPVESRLRNLVLLLQWSDHSDRVLPSREDYEILMNNDGPHPLCPTGSIRDVFVQNSYGALEVESYVTDWIPMDNTEEYYSNGDKGMTTYIHHALRYALEYVDQGLGDEEIDFDFFDEDQDGYIDAITFIHSGYPAEIGGTDIYGRFYEQRIWSHKWWLDQPFQSKKGRNVQVSSYHISAGVWGLKGSEIARIGVIAHEMAHFLGLPDLYDYDASSFGLGDYGLMANPWGANGQQRHPPYMSPFAKLVLGWISPVEATPGINMVEASAEQNPSYPQLYIIKEGFPEGEFLLIENRQPVGFDALLPQGGIAIWHIDYGSAGTFDLVDIYHRQTREGHPDQEGWPENGNHYAVALLQADGFYDLEMRYNTGDYEDLFHAGNVKELVPCREKHDCQYPNTDSYQGGNVTRSNVHITDISASGNIMTFHYMVGESHETEFPTDEPTFFPTYLPSPSPSASPTTEKERIGRKIGRICRNDRQCTSGICKKRWRWFFGMGWSYFGKCASVDNETNSQ